MVVTKTYPTTPTIIANSRSGKNDESLMTPQTFPVRAKMANDVSKPRPAKFTSIPTSAIVTIDCSITDKPVPSIVGTMMTGCRLHTQKDRSRIRSKNNLLRPNISPSHCSGGRSGWTHGMQAAYDWLNLVFQMGLDLKVCCWIEHSHVQPVN